MLLAHDLVRAPGDHGAVLLLHAGVTDRRMWDPQVAALSPHRTVLRCDLRGFGDSPLPAQPYRSVDDVVHLLDHAGLEDVSIVGASMGGQVALQIAASAPARVDRLVLLCAAVPGMQRTPALVRVAEAEDALLEAGDVEGAVRLNVDTWLGPDGTVPTLLVSGGHDIDAFEIAARELATGNPGARHLRLDWAGHLPSLERPDEISALLVDALAPSSSIMTNAPTLSDDHDEARERSS